MPPASVVKLAALTVLLNAVIPVELAVNLPSGFVRFPTASLNVTLPLPAFAVKSLPLTVSLKVIPLPERVGLLATVTPSP